MLFIKAKGHLEDCICTVHLELVIVPAQICHQILDDPLGLNSSPAAFLQRHSLIRDMFRVVVALTNCTNSFLHVSSPRSPHRGCELLQVAHHRN